MLKKKLFVITGIFIFALAVSACGNSSEMSRTERPIITDDDAAEETAGDNDDNESEDIEDNVSDNEVSDEYPSKYCFSREINEENETYGMLTAYDSKGMVMWEYVTDTSADAEGLDMQDVGQVSGGYLIMVGGSLVMVDTYGTQAWVNDDFCGIGACSMLQDNGEIYMCCEGGPDLFIVDEGGNTLKYIKHFDNEYYRPYSLDLTDYGDICISYDSDDSNIFVNPWASEDIFSDGTSEAYVIGDYVLNADIATYSDNDGNSVNYVYYEPYITGDTADIRKANDEIDKFWQEYTKPAYEAMDEGVTLNTTTVDFQVTHSAGVVSFELFAKNDFDFDDYITLNFDLDGNRLTNKEFIEYVGVTEDEVYQAMYSVLEQQCDTYMEGFENESYYDTLVELKEQTLDESNCNINVPMFIGNNGNIWFASGVYTPAGAGYYYDVFDTGINLQ